MTRLSQPSASELQDAAGAPDLDLRPRNAAMVVFEKVCFHYSKRLGDDIFCHAHKPTFWCVCVCSGNRKREAPTSGLFLHSQDGSVHGWFVVVQETLLCGPMGFIEFWVSLRSVSLWLSLCFTVLGGKLLGCLVLFMFSNIGALIGGCNKTCQGL